MENIFAKGGKTKVKYDYIPQKAIDELSYTIDKVTKGISGDKLLSGVYVKSDAKSKTKSGSNLTAKILAMTDDEDKKEVILEKDVKEFQKYISDKLITAFYLGLPLAYDFKGDYSYGGGVITMVVDDAKRKTTQAIKNAKNKKFEMGLKYPQYDFEKLLGKPIIKDVFGKTMTFNDGTTEKYKYRLWIWKDCVIGQTLGSENSSRGFNDYTYGKEPTLIGGYKSVQTSKESKLESIINFMAKDKDGFVKDNNVLYNGLGGANFETLETNKIKFAKGGEMDSEDIVSVYQFGKEKDADDFFLMADKFTDYDVLRLSPFAIQYVGGKEGFEFLYDRAETYESNSLDLYAKGGRLDVKRIKSKKFKTKKEAEKRMNYLKTNPFYDKNGKKIILRGIRIEKEQDGYIVNASFLKRDYRFAKGGKTKRSKHSLMQDRRRVSSEPWEVAYQKRKSKMEAGGTLPTPFGQAGIVGETGAMNEMELFAMGGGLPQGVHQYYAQTYNPAYPTPHGYAKGGSIMSNRDAMEDFINSFSKAESDKIEKSAQYYSVTPITVLSTLRKYYKVNRFDDGSVKQIRIDLFDEPSETQFKFSKKYSKGEKFAKGGMTDVERQSMIDMGYTQEQIKEVEDNPRRGGRFAKGGEVKSKLIKDLDEVRNKFTDLKLKADLHTEKGVAKFRKKAQPLKNQERKIEAKLTAMEQEAYILPFAKGGEVGGGAFDLSLREKSAMYKYLDKGDFTEEKFMKMFDKNEPQTADIIYYWAESRGLNTPQSRRLHKSFMNLMAKGGEIQMSEVYNVNGKDYLFSTPIQNAKGTYTGWDAYEVVYDTFDGEKHLNYTKTKKGKSKYFPNGVKRTEAEDYFAKGGEVDYDFSYLIDRLIDLGDDDFVNWAEKNNQNPYLLKYELIDRLTDYHGEEYAKGGVLSLNKKLKSYIDTLGKEDLISMRNELGREIDKGILDESKYKDELAYLNNRIGKNMYAKGGKTQGYNDKLDESLGNTKGKRSTKEQNYKDRRNESEAMKKKGGKRKYSSVKTMDKSSRSKRKTPLTLAKEIRKEGEKWQDAVKRASAIIKKEAK